MVRKTEDLTWRKVVRRKKGKEVLKLPRLSVSKYRESMTVVNIANRQDEKSTSP
jgi:hypothetical protein